MKQSTTFLGLTQLGLWGAAILTLLIVKVTIKWWIIECSISVILLIIWYFFKKYIK